MRIPLPSGRLAAFSLLPLLLLEAACNPLRDEDRSDGDKSPWDVTSVRLASPLSYSVADPDCQRTEGDASLETKSFTIWNGQGTSEESFDIPDLNGHDSVSSRSISQTYYGYHQRTTTKCHVDASNNVSCDAESKQEMVSEIKLLKLCNGKKSYGTQTIEGATLSSLANIERARSHYESLSLKSSRYSAAYLLMMPNYEEVVDAYKPSSAQRVVIRKSSTDNAGFGAIKSDTGSVVQVFVVFPKSIELNEKPEWAKINLWEVPWVMAHEFGHQIFYTHYSNYLSDTDSRGLSFELGNGIWDNRKDPKDALPYRKSEPLRLAGRTVGLGTTLSALNEGFADLFGAYAIGDKEDFAANLPCFGKSRDFRSAYFADGKSKILTDDVLATYLSTTEEAKPDDCEKTYFQDSHHVGAIIAHGFSRLFTARLGTGATPEEKSELLLEWLTRFDALREAESSLEPRTLMQRAIQAAIEVAKGPEEALSQEICTIAKEVFPAYKSSLFRDEGDALAPFTCGELVADDSSSWL